MVQDWRLDERWSLSWKIFKMLMAVYQFPLCCSRIWVGFAGLRRKRVRTSVKESVSAAPQSLRFLIKPLRAHYVRAIGRRTAIDDPFHPASVSVAPPISSI